MQIKIPKNIQREINYKGFYIYEYLSDREMYHILIKTYMIFLNFSISFGKLLTSVFIFGILLILPFGILFPFILLSLLGVPAMIYFIGIYINYILIFIAILLGGTSTFFIMNNANIFIGKNYFLLGKKINSITNNHIKWDKNMYEKKFFQKEKYLKGYNLLHDFKLNYIQKYIEKGIKDDKKKKFYNFIVKITDIITGPLVLFNLFVFFIIGFILIYLTKKIAFFLYIILNHKIYRTKKIIEKIEEASDKLFYYKLQTGKVIKQRKIGKIKGIIKLINKNIKISEKSIKKLKIQLKNNDLQNIFDFETYNIWLKKQIISPLNSINKLLQKNKISIQKELENLEKNKTKIDNKNLQQNLELAKMRLVLAKNNLTKNIESLENYILKLKI